METIDTWRAAHQMIKMHGAAAELQAALRADHLLEKGDPDGSHAWKRIMDAIRDLLRDKRAPTENFQ